MKKIVMTGGGTAGHVTPNIALMPTLREAGFEIYYIGSYEGMEKGLIEKLGVPYYGVSTGKLRRYMDVRNLTDPFRVMKGIGEAKKILKDLNIKIIAEDTGGTYGRTVSIDLNDGVYKVKTIDKGEKEI